MTTRPVLLVRTDGRLIHEVPGEWDGTSVIEKKARRRYIVLSEPYQKTVKSGVGTKAINVFFVSTSTATTWDPDIMRAWRESLVKLGLSEAEAEAATPEGIAVDAPGWTSTVIDEDPSTGEQRPYRVTPEYIFEMADASDMRAWNQAAGTNKMMLWLSAGAGAAGMVGLYFIFQLVKGTSFFGHSG